MGVKPVKIGVVIPWREHPSRLRPFNEVIKWYNSHMPQADIYLCDNGNTIWEMSGTRNLGIRTAQNDDCDVIILNDADTIPPLAPLQQAIWDALDDNLIHNPYHIYAYLNQSATEEYFNNGVPLNMLPYNIIDSCSGTMVFTPRAWWDLGGADEKFKRWGYEDSAQHLVHRLIHKRPFVKHNGTIYAFYHVQQDNFESPSINLIYNKDLYLEYLRIFNTGDQQAILQLVKEERLSIKCIYN